MLLLIIVLVLLFGGGGGYYGYSQWGAGGGLGIFGTVLLVAALVYLFGGLRSRGDHCPDRSTPAHARSTGSGGCWRGPLVTPRELADAVSGGRGVQMPERDKVPLGVGTNTFPPRRARCCAA